MRLPRTLNARLTLLLLIFGLGLIGANLVRNKSWIQERRIMRFEEEITEMGVRLSGMMQHFVRREAGTSAQLEMSYAATTPHLELGLVCDATRKVRFATHLQWVGTMIDETPLKDAMALAQAVTATMTPSVNSDHSRMVLTGAFPFYEQYHSRDRGVVILRYDMSDALRQSSHEAVLESFAQACALLAVCLLLWLALDMMVMRRVQELAGYAAAVGSGHGVAAHLREGDELSVVAESFENAVKNLHATELRLLEASEAERRRIGSDLHDDVCQRVVAAQLKSGVLQAALQREGHAQAPLAGAVADELAKAVSVARGFARGLAPMLVQKGRLAEVLDELAVTVRDSFGVPCEVSCDEGTPALGLWVDTHLYRIVQELATNAAKHAAPSWIRMGIRRQGALLRLEVESDGRPFEPGARSSIGHEMVGQRARALGGRWGIEQRAEGAGSLAWCEMLVTKEHFTDDGVTG